MTRLGSPARDGELSQRIGNSGDIKVNVLDLVVGELRRRARFAESRNRVQMGAGHVGFHRLQVLQQPDNAVDADGFGKGHLFGKPDQLPRTADCARAQIEDIPHLLRRPQPVDGHLTAPVGKGFLLGQVLDFARLQILRRGHLAHLRIPATQPCRTTASRTPGSTVSIQPTGRVSTTYFEAAADSSWSGSQTSFSSRCRPRISRITRKKQPQHQLSRTNVVVRGHERAMLGKFPKRKTGLLMIRPCPTNCRPPRSPRNRIFSIGPGNAGFS